MYIINKNLKLLNIFIIKNYYTKKKQMEQIYKITQIPVIELIQLHLLCAHDDP